MGKLAHKLCTFLYFKVLQPNSDRLITLKAYKTIKKFNK